MSVLVFEKATGKMLEILQYEIGGYTRKPNSASKSGLLIRDRHFEKFGKKMANKILKIII